MALAAMAAHRLRAFLTMLGIIIGIAAVSSVVALGNASQRKVLSDIANLGTNTIEVFPGKDFGDARAGKIKTLVLDDARALDRQDFNYFVAAGGSGCGGTIRVTDIYGNQITDSGIRIAPDQIQRGKSQFPAR